MDAIFSLIAEIARGSAKLVSQDQAEREAGAREVAEACQKLTQRSATIATEVASVDAATDAAIAAVRRLEAARAAAAPIPPSSITQPLPVP